MRILALDVGERRVGMAISDLTGALARPLEALARRSREEDFAAIAAVVAEHDVELIVVGQPLSLDGGMGPQARQIARYAEALAEHLSVRIVMWDERFTTMEAEEILRQRRSEKKRRQARASGELDAIAAAVILQSYLDSRYLDDHYHGAEPPPGDV
ncbi:MAG: Holliday junction resolvase RuvX [Anaerolineae bacterium]|nr:Holliday junction resolvase RuvX [Anaerolineae bacterium]